MQAIRFITTSKAPFPIKKLPRSSSILTPSSFFSTDSSSSSSSPTSSTTTTTTTASNENRVIGSVKFYQNRKSFGFIKSDVDDSEYFVHRVNIRGAPSNDVANPILKVGEKVSFEKIARNDGKEGFQADDIIYEDGTNIPVYREGHMDRYSISAKRNFGIEVYEILSDGGDEEEMALKIAEAYTKTRKRIDTIAAKHQAAVSSSDTSSSSSE